MDKKIFTLLAIVGLIGLAYLIYTNQNYNGTQLLQKHSLKHEQHSHKAYHAGEHKPHHVCKHDKILKEHYEKLEYPEIDPKKIPKEMTLEYENELIKKHGQGNFQPIRIVNKIVTSASQLDAEMQKFITNELLGAVISYIQKSIYVFPLTAPIKVKGSMCGDDAAVPMEDRVKGVSNADITFYTEARHMDDDTLAYAGPCQFDPTTGRSIAGFITINTKFLKEHLSAGKWQDWVDTLVHEMFHALGFSDYMMKKFPTGNPLVVAQGRTWFKSEILNNYASRYFTCKDIYGIPMEDEGGSGSKGSHWERTVLGNEGMTASSMAGSVFSPFTFAAFETSGWYKVDYNYAQMLLWGHYEGCQFVYQACPASTFRERCEDKGQVGCSYDFAGVATCSKTDPFGDKCSFWQSSWESCTSLKGLGGQIGKAVGGGAGPTSRCWVTNLPGLKGTTTSSGGEWLGACFPSDCLNGKPRFQVSGQWQECQTESQKITVGKGWIQCPNFNVFCLSENSCPNQCNQRGSCRQGKCVCYEGFQGDDCGKRY